MQNILDNQKTVADATSTIAAATRTYSHVKALREDTLSNPDVKYVDERSDATIYKKEYDFPISSNTNDPKTSPNSQKSSTNIVVISPDPEKSTQFPLAPRHEKINNE